MLMATFWLATILYNPYDNKFAGIFFEVLWLPMLLGFILLPAVALIFWYHKKFNERSLNLLSVIITGVVFAVLNFK